MSPTPQGVITVAVILPSFASIAVALRFYVRRKKKTQLRSDDWTILVALMLTWGLGALLIVGSAIGSFGGHTAINPMTGADVITSHEINAVKLEFSAYLIMSLTFGIIKLSVLLLYRRLFVGSLFNFYSFAMCGVITLWSLSFFFAFAFQCGTDITSEWTSTATVEANCDNTSALNVSFVISDVITDVMILIIPLPIIWRLQMSTANKVGLTGIFLLGMLATASSIARMAIVIPAELDTTLGYRDLRALITNIEVWSQVEAGVAVIAACLPTLRPLFLGKSLESLVSSIRSMLSLTSLDRSQPNRRRGSDSDGFINLDLVGVSDSKRSQVKTKVTGDLYECASGPTNGIMIHHSIESKKEHFPDLERTGSCSQNREKAAIGESEGRSLEQI